MLLIQKKFVVLIFFMMSLYCKINYAFASEIQDDNSYLQEILKLPTDAIYRMRFTNPDLDNKRLFDECVKRGHPIAILELIENFLIGYATENGVSNLTITETEIKNCHGMPFLPNKKNYTITNYILGKSRELQKEEIITIKKLTKDVLGAIFNNPLYGDYCNYFGGVSGLTGLHPYRAFFNKNSLTSEEFKEIFLYWVGEYRKSTKYYKYDSDTNETILFMDSYPTTSSWIQILYYTGIQDPDFALFVNHLLEKIDALPTEPLEGVLPWWKNTQWRKSER